jgi:hypothetical protein
MTKPLVTCCKLWQAPYGSGYHWTHSKFCKVAPGQKVGGKTLRVPKKRVVTPKLQALRDHPAVPVDGGNRAIAIWEEHADGCPGVPAPALCAPCANVNFWLDRDDDMEAADA